MSIATAAMVFITLWWCVLFMLFSIGVRTPADEGIAPVPGTPASAPLVPRVGRKMLWSLLISAAIFAAFYALFHYGVIDLSGETGDSQ